MIQGIDANKVESLIKGGNATIERPGVRQSADRNESARIDSANVDEQLNGVQVDTSSLIGPSPIEKELREAEVSIDQFLSEIGNKSLRFEKDDNTGRMVIQIVNKETDEVERQIPPKEFLELVANLNKVSAELLKDLPKFI
jgi:flagellar protein FlaG